MNTSASPKLLTLVTRKFQGQPMWAVDHPEHGPLLMAKHVLEALGYSVGQSASAYLNQLMVPKDARVMILRTMLDEASIDSANIADCYVRDFPRRGANFLTRASVRKLLMASTKPKATEFRDWLAGVSIAVEDTGGYLLNEEARDMAFADTRTTVPLPSEIAGGYGALIEARRAELRAREGELDALMKAASEQAERERIAAEMVVVRAREAAERERADRLSPLAAVGSLVADKKGTLGSFVRGLPDINRNQIKADLMSHGYLYRSGTAYRVYSKYRSLFVERETHHSHGVAIDIHPTAAGRALVTQLYLSGRLTMLRGKSPIRA